MPPISSTFTRSRSLKMIGYGVSTLNSVESASFKSQPLRANSMQAVCMPRQIPKYGTFFSRAYRIAISMPSIPRFPKPPGTRMPSYPSSCAS